MALVPRHREAWFCIESNPILMQQMPWYDSCIFRCMRSERDGRRSKSIGKRIFWFCEDFCFYHREQEDERSHRIKPSTRSFGLLSDVERWKGERFVFEEGTRRVLFRPPLLATGFKKGMIAQLLKVHRMLRRE